MTLSRLFAGTVLALSVSVGVSVGASVVAGCSSSSTTPSTDKGPAVDPGVTAPAQPAPAGGDGQGSEVNPYGKPYPTQNLGYQSRAGKRAGNIMRNYKFLGYRDGDPSKGKQIISLADLYDPEMRTNKLIHFSAGAIWCGPCNDEASSLVPLVPQLKAKKIIIIQALIEGAAKGTGATLNDLDVWQQRHKVNYTLFTDPEQQNLGQFFEAAAVPWNALLDARSMEILMTGVGYDQNMSAEYDSWSTWIDQNPAQAVQ